MSVFESHSIMFAMTLITFALINGFVPCKQNFLCNKNHIKFVKYFVVHISGQGPNIKKSMTNRILF